MNATKDMTGFGFNGYLSQGFPSQIIVDLTEFCNLACIHCPYEEVIKVKGKGQMTTYVVLGRRVEDTSVAGASVTA